MLPPRPAVTNRERLVGDVVVGGSLGQCDHEITEFSRKEVSKVGPGRLSIH